MRSSDFLKRAALAALLLLKPVANAQADILDPFDPFDMSGQEEVIPDSDKSATELILEANLLLQDDRPLDARTKLLTALRKDPKQYQAHVLLAGYYMVHVGHFRLALKYIKQAQDLFFAKNGQPPYKDTLTKQEHAHILYLLSQIKLDLDNYQGALEVLDEFYSHDYYASWYAGTRAWVLMKLGRIDEAIKISRLGLLAGAEQGRTLNMLGILLSMKGERDAALQVFKDAVRHEMSLGTLGQPATPLNNSGEVYKEIFVEDSAESSWLRAASMPDGCEHVLPSLNLSLLYIDELNVAGAKKAMDNFESCVAQYPLKNGEEHRALVRLARGRIALHTGHAEEAVKHFEAALEDRQWFGKIGTSQQDLAAGTMISLAQALRAQNNHNAFKRYSSWSELAASIKDRYANETRAWWNLRRAAQILTTELTNLEDIYIRNTDSMIEYPTFGTLLSTLPYSALERRIELEKLEDKRPEAVQYYKAYLAENMIKGYRQSKGLQLLDEVIRDCRERYDDNLKVHSMLLKLQTLDSSSTEYVTLAHRVFVMSRAHLRNYGLALPVNYEVGKWNVRRELSNSAFILDNTRQLQYSISYSFEGGEHVLSFNSTNSAVGDVRVQGKNLKQVINDLNGAVFSVELDS